MPCRGGGFLRRRIGALILITVCRPGYRCRAAHVPAVASRTDRAGADAKLGAATMASLSASVLPYDCGAQSRRA